MLIQRLKVLNHLLILVHLVILSMNKEILFMLGAIFELISIRRDRHIWLIQVRLCANNDQTTKSVLEDMKKGYGGDQTQTDLLSFGTVLANIGEIMTMQRNIFIVYAMNFPRIIMELHIVITILVKLHLKKKIINQIENFPIKSF